MKCISQKSNFNYSKNLKLPKHTKPTTMKELVALQVKIFSILHSLKQEHLINEAQAYSFKGKNFSCQIFLNFIEKTLNLDSSVIYIIGEYEENEDEEQLRKNILDLIKPTGLFLN